jgi:hypothetical protein
MNLRIMKKLSARAAPLLPLLGDHRKQFLAEKDDNYHGMAIRDRACWERSHCHPTFQGWGDDIAFSTRAGNRVVMRQPVHPLERTMMVGEMSGYYEPEWGEECAWLALYCRVFDHFTDWSEFGATMTRKFRNPGDVFRAAEEMIEEFAG